MYLEKRLKEAIAAGLPRKELNHTECFVCPWCGSDQLEEHPPEDGLGPFDCTVCHKSFASDMDANGTLYTQGLMTDADMRYMAWKAARKIKVGRRALEQEGRMDEIVERGPWWAGQDDDGRIYVQSQDFTHDVRLYVDGDFIGPEQKLAYAREIARRLNAEPAADLPVRNARPRE